MVIPEHRGGGVLLPAAYIGVSSALAHERLGHRGLSADKVKLEELGSITVSNQRDKDDGKLTYVRRLSTITYLSRREPRF